MASEMFSLEVRNAVKCPLTHKRNWDGIFKMFPQHLGNRDDGLLGCMACIP